MDELAELDGMALSALIAKGELSALEALDASIDRIERLNPSINAVVHAHFDLAREQVRHVLPKGPLSGVPMLLKNTGFEAAGMILSTGSELHRHTVSQRDSTITARYKAAGMVILGKSNTPEFALSFTAEPEAFGATRNPWDLERTSGGSSGGSTAAVASGMVPVANSSDGAGSTRLPASHCGLFGLKPSRLVNPVGPVAAEAIAGMSTPHAVTWSVRDSAAMLDATGGPDLGDPWASPARPGTYLAALGALPPRLKVAMLLKPPTGTPVDAEVLAEVRAAARLLEGLGHQVTEIDDAGYDGEALKAAWRVIAGVNVGLGAAGGDPGSPNIARLEPVNQEWVREGLATSGTRYLWAVNQLHASARAMGRFFSRYDIMLTPSAAEAAPKIGTLAGAGKSLDAFFDQFWAHSPFTAVFNTSGCPAMSVPLGMTPGGMPVGVHFGAGFGKDALLLSLAAELERAAPWAGRRPPVPG
ncbi:amidase [Mesorhizobium marinum]|uniref:amidase n=1 Tax=Mesorhizobium marinum TaxID=3228790 RepID=UPI0034668A2C